MGSRAPSEQRPPIGGRAALATLVHPRRAGTAARVVLACALCLVAACQADKLLTAPRGPGQPGGGERPPASRLAFTVSPAPTEVGAAIAPAVEVTARDESGNTAAGFTGAVTISLGTNPGAATLTGPTTRNAVAGIATFSGLVVSAPGTGYRLTATAQGLASATSSPFDIIPDDGGGGGPGPATTLTRVSGDGQADTVAATLAGPYVVRVTDASGRPVPGVAVTWALDGGGNGAITPASSVTNANGEASAVHRLGTTAGQQAATAAVAGLAGSPARFTATATHATPTQIVFTTQPSNTGIGAIIAPPVVVAIRDRFGNPATNLGQPVSVSIAPLTGTPGASLSGTRARNPVGGIATFDDLRIDLVGTLYRLRVQAGSLTVDSSPFTILL
jgi:hypothetical protein